MPIPSNITALAIDPSIRACGWALLVNGQIIAGLAQSKDRQTHKAILQIYRFLYTICPPDLAYLIIEKPVLIDVWTKEKKENVAKLLASYDKYLTLGYAGTDKHRYMKCKKIWTPIVPEWKGQMNKDVCWNRTKQLIDENNIQLEIRPNIPESLLHNTHDAIGLLVRFLQKERFID